MSFVMGIVVPSIVPGRVGSTFDVAQTWRSYRNITQVDLGVQNVASFFYI